MSRLTEKTRRRAPRFEYGVYFAVIFLCSLPVALAQSLIATFGRAQPRVAGRPAGFVSRAWSEARTVTPMIFSA